MGAKEAYIKGFHASHPKVAWALEGLGKIHEKERKEGSLEAALTHPGPLPHILHPA